MIGEFCTTSSKFFVQIVCLKASTSATTRLDREVFRQYWAKRLSLPSLHRKPKRRVKESKWSIALYTIYRFLRSLPPQGPPQCVIEKVSTSKCAFIIGSTLHVRPHYLYTRNELNFIALATHFQLIEEVRIHTFHIRIFLTARKARARLGCVHWELVKLILRFVNRGPWVIKEGRVERAIKITFDDFLKPAVEAWRGGLPYWKILQDIPETETDIISTYRNLDWVHRGVSPFEDGYSSDSEAEVDYANDAVDSDSDTEFDIMKVDGYPFFLLPAV